MRHSRSLTVTALAASAALALTACTDSDSASETTTVTEATTATETATDTATTTAGDDTASASDSQTPAAAADGDDPVFAAIDAVLAQHPEGVIVTIDREDDNAVYEVDVVVGEEVLELDVAEDGSIREDDREDDEDDEVAEARQATVTAADAIAQALDQHPDGVLDEAELDEDDGVLRWEIELDDENRNDLAEVTVPAT